ncbi:MAG TPA: hypothetical protein VFA06_05620 [Actinocrinis sp.]|uniref:hypothetical protein n=1 Tax=Actinocrinis sp. TaxID=1920516 RepID=UPI002D6513FA|nr:hypothetical protein [Actinocrinis sp.]HZU55326.1 hypothetical protein [Actinocrinis sp.]
MSKPAVHGPYGTEAQARADVDALHARAAAAGESDMRRAQVRALLGTLHRLGVRAGTFDQLILASLGQWEPTTTVVMLGLVERAHAAGRKAAREDTR